MNYFAARDGQSPISLSGHRFGQATLRRVMPEERATGYPPKQSIVLCHYLRPQNMQRNRTREAQCRVPPQGKSAFACPAPALRQARHNRLIVTGLERL